MMNFVRAHAGLYVLVATVVLSPAAWAEPWQTDYSTALDAARAAHKPLLVVMEMPTDRLAAAGASQLASSALLKPYHLCCIDVSTSL
ncbi:MAG: hypothetical protein GTO53_02900, partial [Planctomycetales bacterium]|nr:hypothetical protein [Planctomycetales bacterium]NIM08118.1 hypothetical protein [Planctomycetales bacterium]NIN07613.1 hypothetical protein [Planctomycetales bacterium]NIN76735.1 hypothetical protein [Planctomycetales bacterium]NIO33924.1 hypothetical protein [Planctomycetales bacterium]